MSYASQETAYEIAVAEAACGPVTRSGSKSSDQLTSASATARRLPRTKDGRKS